MKRAAIFAVLLLVSFLVSCASTTNYPITLSYQPLKEYEKTAGAPVAVTLLSDTRPVADKRVIGEKEGGAPFVALLDEPAAALSKGLAVYLENRGYTVNRINKAWDGTIQSLNPDWGNFVIGGTLDALTLTVKETLVKTEYDCSVRFVLSFADAKSRELLHKERFEVATSYVTFPFSREKAEELINKTLSEAVERALADINKYIRQK